MSGPPAQGGYTSKTLGEIKHFQTMIRLAEDWLLKIHERKQIRSEQGFQKSSGCGSLGGAASEAS